MRWSVAEQHRSDLYHEELRSTKEEGDEGEDGGGGDKTNQHRLLPWGLKVKQAPAS